MKVFIGGSRRISRLAQEVQLRIDNIAKKDFTVLVGDANGVDKAVQAYLAQKKYSKVIVFCSGSRCRNNVGRWNVQSIATDTDKKTFAFYAAKDEEMARLADYGLMIWDAKSKGTLNNACNLTKQGKKVVVYVAPEGKFYTVSRKPDLNELFDKYSGKPLGSDFLQLTFGVGTQAPPRGVDALRHGGD